MRANDWQAIVDLVILYTYSIMQGDAPAANQLMVCISKHVAKGVLQIVRILPVLGAHGVAATAISMTHAVTSAVQPYQESNH